MHFNQFLQLISQIVNGQMSQEVMLACIPMMTLADRLVMLSHDLEHLDRCENSKCIRCEAVKQPIQDQVPEWAKQLARPLAKRYDVQFKTLMEDWNPRQIAEALEVEIDFPEELSNE